MTFPTTSLIWQFIFWLIEKVKPSKPRKASEETLRLLREKGFYLSGVSKTERGSHLQEELENEG